MQTGEIETPAARGASVGNFPAGCGMPPGRLRPRVAACHARARAADDVTGDPPLSPEDKVARLDGLEAAGAPGALIRRPFRAAHMGARRA